jgi:hypothetical protein
MNEPGRYEPTWRDDAELDALLRTGKIIGLADIDHALVDRANGQPNRLSGDDGGYSAHRHCRIESLDV